MFDTRLYAIVDVDVAARHGLSPAALAASLVDGGTRLLQVRAKSSPARDALAAVEAVVAIARRSGALVIVNDRVDVAVAARADGVHVGQDDLPPAAVRRVVDDAAVAPGSGERSVTRVGWSTHTRAQVDASRALPIDYVAVGPVFGTDSKETAHAPVGLELVEYAAARGGGRPVVAIGGITLARAPDVVRAGAAAVAVISDLLAGGRPGDRARAFLDAMRGA